jgi:hypothetical protein
LILVPKAALTAATINRVELTRRDGRHQGLALAQVVDGMNRHVGAYEHEDIVARHRADPVDVQRVEFRRIRIEERLKRERRGTQRAD